VMVEDAELGTGFRTGDRGRLDENGYLFITGRFKEEYKLENGKYVHPASLEEDIKLNSYIANAMIYGEGKAYNVCIIVPDFIALASYVESLGLSADGSNEIVSDERVQAFLGSEVANQLKINYGGYEIPKKFIFVPEDFTVENGLLTQTMKLKRKIVLNHYQDELDSLYT